MDSTELLNLYAALRLGASMKLLEGITPSLADRLLIEGMPNTLTISQNLENDSGARDRARADRLRKILTSVCDAGTVNA